MTSDLPHNNKSMIIGTGNAAYEVRYNSPETYAADLCRRRQRYYIYLNKLQVIRVNIILITVSQV